MAAAVNDLPVWFQIAFLALHMTGIVVGWGCDFRD
jgi:hypothetical protein